MHALGEGVKKVFLAGIGALSLTAEKSKELLEGLVARGELTVEEGREMARELNRKASSRTDAALSGELSRKKQAAGEKIEALWANIQKMTDEELALLKAKLMGEIPVPQPKPDPSYATE